MKKWIMRKHVGAKCPVCGKPMAIVEKVRSTVNGTQHRVLKCYNSRCRYESK